MDEDLKNFNAKQARDIVEEGERQQLYEILQAIQDQSFEKKDLLIWDGELESVTKRELKVRGFDVKFNPMTDNTIIGW